jgi:hypothetical protein
MQAVVSPPKLRSGIQARERHMRVSNTLFVALSAALFMSGCGSNFFFMGQHESVRYDRSGRHMSEELRGRARSVAVVADSTPPELRIRGDYGQYVPTVGEGAGAGAAVGARVTGEMVADDPRSIFFVPFVLPIAMIAGSVTGAGAAKIEQELAEFREGMADDLAAESGSSFSLDQLVSELEERIAAFPNRDISAEEPDVILEVRVPEITIETQDKDANVATSGHATLRDSSDGSVLYSGVVEYVERDSLSNWTADGNAAWSGYVDRARSYVAAELSASLFETIIVRHVLRPRKTETFRANWSGQVRTSAPLLAWELFLLGGDDYEGRIDRDEITWDLRLFDNSRLVYVAEGIRETEHTVTAPLADCRTIAWSVRPVYKVDGERRAGEWMNYRSNFERMRTNDAINAYFAKFRTRCAS